MKATPRSTAPRLPLIPHTSVGDARYQALVASALDLIAERGMEGLRLREVAARVGIHHATLHYYFPTKPDLVKAVADTLTQAIIATPIPGETREWATLSAREFLQQYLRNTAYQLRTTPQRFIVMCELFLHARRDPAIAAQLQGATVWHTLLREPLTRGIAEGELRADLDVSAVVDLIITFSLGLPLLQGTQSHAVEHTITQFTQMLLAFVLPPSAP